MMMETAGKTVKELEADIARVETELQGLNAQLAEARKREHEAESASAQKPWKWPLKADEYDRYARQLILPTIGIEGTYALSSRNRTSAQNN